MHNKLINAKKKKNNLPIDLNKCVEVDFHIGVGSCANYVTSMCDLTIYIFLRKSVSIAILICILI